jgi:hypothetical protein
MYPTSPFNSNQKLQLANLFDDLTPFIPETPIIKAKDPSPFTEFEDISEFKLDEDESPLTKIKKIRRKTKKHKKSIETKPY